MTRYRLVIEVDIDDDARAFEEVARSGETSPEVLFREASALWTYLGLLTFGASPMLMDYEVCRPERPDLDPLDPDGGDERDTSIDRTRGLRPKGWL